MSAVAAERPALRVVEGGRLRSVEIAQQRENHDAWELADAIYEDVLSLIPDEVATSSTFGAPGVNTGTGTAQDAVYDAHRAAGTEVGQHYLRQMFDTVRVWPAEDRLLDKASFAVHCELRGKDYPNRREIIQKLASKSRNGRVSWSDLRRWKSERKPTPFKTFLQIADERIRRVVHDVGKPWHMVAEDDRAAIADILRTIAAEIEAESFA